MKKEANKHTNAPKKKPSKATRKKDFTLDDARKIAKTDIVGIGFLEEYAKVVAQLKEANDRLIAWLILFGKLTSSTKTAKNLLGPVPEDWLPPEVK